MSKFKNQMVGKQTIGNRVINADEALGLTYTDVKDAKLISIRVAALSANPFQPRKKMDPITIQELSESILQNGLLQPIIITPINGNPKKFYIVAGHRRVEAYKILKLENINAIVINIDEGKMRIDAIIENLQREDLTPFEEAMAIKSLNDSGMKQVEIAEKLGKSKGHISDMIGITELDQNFIDYLALINVTPNFSLLRELKRVEVSKQLETYKYIDHRSMNRDAIREYIDKLNSGNTANRFPEKPIFVGFYVKRDKSGNKIDIKLDIEQLGGRNEAIHILEKLIEELKND